MTLLGLFVEHLLPVLLIAAAGWALAATIRVDPRPLGSVAFHLMAPCLIFRTLLDSRVPETDMARIGLFTLVVMALPALLGLAVSRVLRWSRARTSAVVLCAMLPNAGNYGLSANLLAFGDEALAYASIFFVAASLLAYSVGVLIASLGRSTWRDAAIGLLRVPSLWALAAALALRSVHATLPSPLERSISMLSAACIPSLLVVLGMQLRGSSLRGASAPLLVGSGLRLLGGMAAGLICAPLFALHGAARQAAIFESSMPTAVITSILASEYGVEPGLVSSVILLTTLLSPLTLTPLLAALR
jgi:malate permease and related proteins